MTEKHEDKKLWYARPAPMMEWGSGRKSKKGTKLALLLSGDDGNVQVSLFVPLVASVAIAYPEAGEWMLNQTMSITSLAMIVTMLFAGRLTYHFDRKNVLLLGTALFCAAGLAGMATWDIYSLFATRLILGIGAGMAFPLVPSAISYLFSRSGRTDMADHEKDQMIGWMNAAGAFLGFTLTLGAGWLATYHWKLAFIFYALFIPILFIQWYFLPHFKPEKCDKDGIMARKEGVGLNSDEMSKRPGTGKGERDALNYRVWLTALGLAGLMTVAMVSNFKLSMFVELGGLGDSANSGMANSLQTCVSFFMGLSFAYIFKGLKRYTPVLGLLFGCASAFCLANAYSIGLVYLGMGLQGACIGLISPFVFSTMSNVAPPSRMTFCMSLVCIAQLIGNVTAPYYLMLADALGVVGDRGLFQMNATVFLVGAVIVAVGMFLASRRTSSDASKEHVC